MHPEYTTFADPVEYCKYLTDVASSYSNSGEKSFYGDTYEQGLNSLIHGSPKYLQQAQDLINKMADAQIFSLHQPIIETSVVGFAPNVPAFLAGQPKDMYTIYNSEDENTTTPINIYVETLVSAGISHEQLIHRGVAVLAFVLAMNNIRPVELYTVCIGHSSGKTTGIVCKVPSKPLSLEQATFMLCDPVYYRRLAFASIYEHAKRNTGSIRWPFDDIPTSDTYTEKLRKYLNLEPHDVFIKGGYLFDETMKNNPIQWVRNMIEQHTSLRIL